MAVSVETIKPGIGAIVRADRSELLDKANAARWQELLEKHGAVVFVRAGLDDQEQLAFTDLLGARVNFTKSALGGEDAAEGVYSITLDRKINPEPEYVLATFFWHMDGLTVPMPPSRASILSCRHAAPKGGQTEFANTYAAYATLPEDEKAALEALRVMHSVSAGVREVVDAGGLRHDSRHEQPLVWKHRNGRRSMLIGYTADTIIGMSKAESRALLARLLEWTVQPAFTYRHNWQEGDLAIWDNWGVLHRVIPYAEDCGRRMHRTSVAGVEMAS
jgi:alpha-ketoglutarate-dependent taurine dioxygenase